MGVYTVHSEHESHLKFLMQFVPVCSQIRTLYTNELTVGVEMHVQSKEKPTFQGHIYLLHLKTHERLGHRQSGEGGCVQMAEHH